MVNGIKRSDPRLVDEEAEATSRREVSVQFTLRFFVLFSLHFCTFAIYCGIGYRALLGVDLL